MQTDPPVQTLKEEQRATIFQDIVEATQADASKASGHVLCATDTQASLALSISQTCRDDANDSFKNSKSDDSGQKKVAKGDAYSYSTLKPGCIRLLGLMPHEDENAPIQCRLFEYPLQESGERVHLYEALSYVWGGSEKPHSVSIGRHDLAITVNLQVALLRLRDRYVERTIWIDAICINQKNLEEQAQQIQYMAEIYSKANCVIVWLGEAAADSDEVLEEIRIAAASMSIKPLVNEPTKNQSILTLLQRPWFERIWVLQEVAAARHILIMCGSTTIDGYTFCLGLQSLQPSYDTHLDLQNSTRSVLYLIRGAIFRPKKITKLSARFSLDIRSLGELIEMYHTRKATVHHDKVFSLLGMSSDDPIAAGLSPNYAVPWEKLLEQLVKLLLGGRVSVRTWAEMEMAVINGKGCILGQVSSEGDTDRNEQHVVITSKGSGYLEPERKWTLPASAKSVQVGDLVCLLRGASKPTIIRPYKDYFFVVVITVPHLQPEHPITNFPHDFLLVWDWEKYQGKLQDPEEYGMLIKSQIPEHSNREEGGRSDKTTRLWNVALILEDAEEYEEAEERLREIVEGCERDVGNEPLRTLTYKDRLALIYKKREKWEESKKLFEQAIQTRKLLQGADHPDTISSMTNLASMYRDQGCWEEAEKVEMMIDILQRSADDEQITEEEVVKIARRFDEEVIMFLLYRRGDEIQITEGVVMAAAENWKSGHNVMRLLLDRRGDEVQITEGVFMAAAKNRETGYEAMSLLLDRKGHELQRSAKGREMRTRLLELRHDVHTNEAADLERPGGQHLNIARCVQKYFDIIKPLGSGGFGKVDHVVSRPSLRHYALKRVSRGRSFEHGEVANPNFVNELKSLKLLSHNHLVKLVGSYTDHDHIGLILTPVADMNLEDYLSAPKPDYPDRKNCLRQFFGCLAAGVEYLHFQKIRHGDIKPKNVLVLLNYRRVLLTDFGTDFGTAYNWSNDPADDTIGPSRYAFTERYCPPEVFYHGVRRPSNDLWSLGCIFLEMSTVLSDLTVRQMQEFFQANGSGKNSIRENLQAWGVWSHKISSQFNWPSDAQVAGLGRELCEWDPDRRPSAAQIASEIADFEGPTKYHCGCCGLKRDTVNPDRASEFVFEEPSPINKSLSDLDEPPSAISVPLPAH